MPKITPVELRGIEFKKVMRGCDPVEVKSCIEQAADALEDLMLENKRLSERVQEFDRLETIIKEAAIQAQQRLKAEEETAKKQAQLIVDRAKMEAEKIIEGAHKDSENLRKELSALKGERDRFVIQFKGILNSLLMMLEEEDFLKPSKEVTPQAVEKPKEAKSPEKQPPAGQG